MARYMRGYGQYRLGEPIVGAGIAWHGPGVYLTSPASPNQQNRRAVHSRLRPPAVVTPATTQIFFGPKVNLSVMLPEKARRTVTSRGPEYFIRPPVVLATNLRTRVTLAAQRRDRRVQSHLFAPIVGAGIAWHGPGLYLTRPKQPPPTLAFLRAPIITPSTQTFYGPTVHLTRIRPRPVYSELFNHVVAAEVQDPFPGLRIKLVPIRPVRLRTTAHLFNYVVPVAAQTYYGPAVHLTRSRRPQVHSFLRPPTDTVGQEDQGLGAFELAYSRRGRPRSFLRAPVDTVGIEDQGRIQVHLVRIKPPRTLGHRTSAIVRPSFDARPVQVQLARIKPVPTTHRLQPPSVVDQAVVALSGPKVHLTYSRRGTPKYRLSAPTAVFPFFPRELPVTLARIRPPLAQAFLRPPTVTDVAVISYGPFQWLTYSRRGTPKSRLQPPAILASNLPTAVTLAPQRRGVPKSRLEPPTVVFLAVEIYGPEQWLTFSRRPITKSELRPPTVVAPVVSYGPAQWLTYSRRGTPTYFLRPPTAVASPPAYVQVLPPWLTYSRRGQPKSFLKPPTRVFPFFPRPTQVFLSPQSRGRPVYHLTPPAVIRIPKADSLQINLTYSRRGAPRYALKPPTVVRAAFYARPVQVHLTTIKPRPTVALIKPPTRVFIPKADVLHVHLTYSRRGRPISFRQPERVGTPPFRGIQVHLARIKHPPVQYTLIPPAVVGAGIAFYGPLTALVRIKHPPVHYFLRLTLVAFRRPHGDVCGFDIAGSFVCSLEVPGSQVTGSSASTSAVSGSSRAASRVQGSESAGGSVSGSDRKAT